jgi:hypothetical protein
MITNCTTVRAQLGAYVDGELDSADRLNVARHLEACEPCGSIEAFTREIGHSLRVAAADPAWTDLKGVASGVVSRVCAEDAQSWRVLVGRLFDDWHWPLVAAGSIASALASLTLVTALCGWQPNRENDESLAGMLNSLQASAGTLLIMTAPTGPDQLPILMQFDDGQRVSTDAPAVLPAAFSSPSEGELVVALSQAVVGPDGRMSDLRSMSQRDRLRTEALFDEIQRLRSVPQASWSSRPVSVERLGLMTNMNVSGKIL